jgi:hypothetical protein
MLKGRRECNEEKELIDATTLKYLGLGKLTEGKANTS